MEPPWEGGKNIYINGPGRMTKIAATPMFENKTFKTLLLQNPKAYDLETMDLSSKKFI